jgi:hypothetical protein
MAGGILRVRRPMFNAVPSLSSSQCTTPSRVPRRGRFRIPVQPVGAGFETGAVPAAAFIEFAD